MRQAPDVTGLLVARMDEQAAAAESARGGRRARARGAIHDAAALERSVPNIDISTEPHVELLALNAAPDRLTAVDQQQAWQVELGVFGPITVMREWALVSAWLLRCECDEAR